jgi:hypothetical protein
MDILNDYYPLYPYNPDTANLSDSELSEREEYINTLTNSRRRLTFDDWCLVYSDELWYMWCMLKEHTTYNILPIFNRMDYGSFCHMAYENSTN